MKKLFLLFISLFLILTKNFAQVGNVGSWAPDFEVVAKCLDSLDLGTNYISFYEVQTIRAGQTTVFNRYRANGSTFTPPGGKQILGSCPTTTTVTPDSIRTIVVLALCDDNTGTGTTDPFFRIVQRTYWPSGGAGTINILATIKQDGTAYTVTGAVTEGPCFITSLDTEVNAEITSNQTYTAPAAGFSAWEVHNVGITIFTMVTNGGTVNLYPGESRYCKEQTNWAMKHMRTCGTITVNASGGTAHVYTRVH